MKGKIWYNFINILQYSQLYYTQLKINCIWDSFYQCSSAPWKNFLYILFIILVIWCKLLKVEHSNVEYWKIVSHWIQQKCSPLKNSFLSNNLCIVYINPAFLDHSKNLVLQSPQYLIFYVFGIRSICA